MDSAPNLLLLDELFKKVRPDEILSDLKDLGVDVKASAFENPTPDEALGLYSLAIQVIFGKTSADVRPEELYQQLYFTGSIANGLEVTEEHLDVLKRGIGNLRLWRFCQAVHKVLGLPRIERYELFSPTRTSFYRLISSLVVYLRFREALCALYSSLIEHLDNLAELEASSKQAIGNIEKEHAKFTALKEQHLDGANDYIAQKKALEDKLLHAQQEYNEYKQRQQYLNTEIDKWSLLVNNVLLELTRERRLYERQSATVSTDPQQLKQEHEQLQHALKQGDEALSIAQANNDAINQHNEMLQLCCNIAQEIRQALSDHVQILLKQMLQETNECQALQEQNRQIQEEIDTQKHKRDGAKADLKELQIQYQKRLAKAKEQADEKIAAARAFAQESEANIKTLQEKYKIGLETLAQVQMQAAKEAQNATLVMSQLDTKVARIVQATNKYKHKISQVPLLQS